MNLRQIKCNLYRNNIVYVKPIRACMPYYSLFVFTCYNCTFFYIFFYKISLFYSNSPQLYFNVNDDVKSTELWQASHLNKSTVIKTSSSNTNINFIEWLVGFVEGDGTFTIVSQQRPNGVYHYCMFKVSQSAYNVNLLIYIKNMLNCGDINAKDPQKQNFDYRVVSRADLINKIVPLFNVYPMHSVKYWRYTLFLEALSLNDPYSPRFAELKNVMVNMPLSYESPFLYRIPSKSWVVGFIEAEGSFHIIERRERSTLEHGFNVVQKLDIPILQNIKQILNINAKVFTPTKSYIGSKSILSTRRIEDIKFLIEYFNNTMVGVKHIEFVCWRDAFINHKGNHNKLREIRENMRVMRNKHKSAFDPEID